MMDEEVVVILVRVLWVFHLIAAVVASGHVLIVHPQARGAALWLGMIWFVPWLGPVFYVVVGVNRIPARARARLSQQESQSSEWREGNKIAARMGGDEAYGAMIAAIDSATSSVDLLTYIFDNDRAGGLFCDAFERAISRGVRVRVVIDAIGARYSHPPIAARLRKLGVELALFLPTTMPWRWRYANMRSHRKLMIVDDSVGFTGGMNIREGCMASLEPRETTLDVHFQVEGPVVADMVALFRGDWNFARGGLKRVEEPISLPDVSAAVPAPLRSGVRARLVSSGPDHVDEPIRWLKLAALVRAERSVRIVTPYFVPDEDVVTSLCAAVSAGIQVQIVLPSQNNLKLVAWASRACWPRLLARGIDIVLSPPPFEHTKAMIVDDELVIVGSANWDERSFRLNFEADLECRDRDLASQLNAMIDARIAEAASTSLASLQEATLLSRLRDGAARLALPYL